MYKIKYDKPALYYDIVLDTSNMNEQETFDLILKELKMEDTLKQSDQDTSSTLKILLHMLVQVPEKEYRKQTKP